MKKATSPIWQNDFVNLPESLRPWIFHQGSFMERLKKQGIKTTSIQVLQNNWELPHPEDKKILGIKSKNFVLVREVLIRGDNKLWMFARTIIPQKAVQKNKLLANLKSRSLGSVLFKDHHLQRSPIEIACLRKGMNLYENIKKKSQSREAEFWARRSIFNFRGEDLLLIEVFLY